MVKACAVQAVMLPGLLTITGAAPAHHSSSMYEMERTVTLRGVVTNFEWVNPHVYVTIETRPGGGDNETWLIEGNPPYLMSKYGWSSRSLAPGELVTVAASPTRTAGRYMARGRFLVKANGTRLGIDAIGDAENYRPLAANPDVSFVTDGLSGNFLTRPSPEVSGRFNPRPSPAFTEKGNAAITSYEGSENPSLGCVSWPPPYLIVLPLLTSIEVGEDVTLIRFEAYFHSQGSEVRTVHMNRDSHEGASYTNQGHSIGWWEGDALVVDTTHFADHRNGHGYGLPSGPQKHVVERFELNADRTGLNYSFWVEDPEYLVEPQAAELELVYRPDLEFMSIPCDQANARRFLEE